MEEIVSFFQKYADDMGIELVDVEWVEDPPTLTAYIEKEGGMDLDTCEAFHNAVFDPIDDLDPTYGESYTLNISSPGLDRPFKTNRDFERNIGKEVELRFSKPFMGKKFHQGTLVSFDDDSVTVKLFGKDTKIAREKIAKISLAIDI